MTSSPIFFVIDIIGGFLVLLLALQYLNRFMLTGTLRTVQTVTTQRIISNPLTIRIKIYDEVNPRDAKR